MSRLSDHSLGMHRSITRRDFLNGVALGVAGLSTLPSWAAALDLDAPQPAGPAAYPPALTGLRGSHVGSFEPFHLLREGKYKGLGGAVASTGEEYDLVIVGGGISGLAAAHLFRKAAGAGARVLVLDNHDDFGGHAKRNEFSHEGRTWIGYGGTQSIDSPAPYSPVAKGLISDLGIDVDRYASVLDAKLYASFGLKPAFFFDKETFGADRLVVGGSRQPDDAFLAASPLSEQARADLKRLLTDAFDPYPGLSSPDKKARLARISYADFLTQLWKVDPAVVKFFQTRPHGLFGVGIDAVPAQDAWGLGLPGFQGLALEAGPGKGQNYDTIRSEEAERYYFHFPDGNASVARLLVRGLVPGALPGSSADDVVTSRADYARLDVDGAPTRIRLNSLVMKVAHRGEPARASGVDVTYLHAGKLQRVGARLCILACWHTVIPFLCPELPDKQKEALAYGVKVPLVYTNVFIRNWKAFQKLGVSSVSAPGLFHTSVGLDFPVSIGHYSCSRSPEEPVVLHLSKVPCQPGLPTRAQHRAGRTQLLATSFETFEREIRAQMARIFGAGGFDPAADILAITVNRWPHGYAYQYNSLFDPFWFEGGDQPCVVGRQRFGRIAIANSDSGAYAYTDSAIDQGHRAVQELLALGTSSQA